MRARRINENQFLAHVAINRVSRNMLVAKKLDGAKVTEVTNATLLIHHYVRTG
jgi:hypothetical protein